MVITVNITDFRKNIFKYGDLVRELNYRIIITKNDEPVFMIIRPENFNKITKKPETLEFLNRIKQKHKS